MKKILIVILVHFSSLSLYSQAPVWVTFSDTVYNYSFSLPGNPVVNDTLNISHYFSRLDSIGFQILVLKSAILDSSNIAFTAMLQQTNGDTLLALTNQLLNSTNSVLTNYQHLPNVAGYSGLEADLKYNTMVNGKFVLNFVRFYIKNNTLFTFSISGYEPDLSNITNNKFTFFNSISL